MGLTATAFMSTPLPATLKPGPGKTKRKSYPSKGALVPDIIGKFRFEFELHLGTSTYHLQTLFITINWHVDFTNGFGQ